MKRRAPAMKLLLFLLAGAIINVTVAWGCALQHPPGTRCMSKEPLPWPSKIPIEWQFLPTLTGRWSQFGRDRCDWMRLNADFDIEATPNGIAGLAVAIFGLVLSLQAWGIRSESRSD